MTTVEATRTESETTTETMPGATPEVAPAPSHDAETLAKIVAMNRSVAEARRRYDRADLTRKAAKETLEECQAELNEFIAGLSEEYPLFDRPKADADAAIEPPWKDVQLSDLTTSDGECLPSGILAALAENDPPLTTLGDLSDWSRSGRSLTGVKGIGEAKAELIDAALDHFWSRRAIDAGGDAGGSEANDVGDADAVPPVPPASPSSWRDTPLGDLGLDSVTLAHLASHDVRLAGQLVGLGGSEARLLDAAPHYQAFSADIASALDRLRGRLSDIEIADFDAVSAGRAGVEADAPSSIPAPPKGRNSRKAVAS